MVPAAGDDGDSLCCRCSDVWQVVLAMVGDTIIKVECKESLALYRYGDPKGKQ